MQVNEMQTSAKCRTWSGAGAVGKARVEHPDARADPNDYGDGEKIRLVHLRR
jgi:hypothetical protein